MPVESCRNLEWRVPTQFTYPYMPAQNSLRQQKTMGELIKPSLLYLSIMIRPDITYAVSNVAKFCVNPCKQHWIAVKRNMRYLKGTLSMVSFARKMDQMNVFDTQILTWLQTQMPAHHCQRICSRSVV